MEKLLKAVRLDLDPNSPTATEWRRWHKTFSIFIQECVAKVSDKLGLLRSVLARMLMSTLKDAVISILPFPFWKSYI